MSAARPALGFDGRKQLELDRHVSPSRVPLQLVRADPLPGHGLRHVRAEGLGLRLGRFPAVDVAVDAAEIPLRHGPQSRDLERLEAGALDDGGGEVPAQEALQEDVEVMIQGFHARAVSTRQDCATILSL